jgi:glutathione S-transferase
VPHRLFVVHGSHPCAAVERAFALKGVPFRRIELPPATHAPIQRLQFGQRTVPGLRLDGGEKVIGSRAIMRRLEQLAPDPPLFPADLDARARVEAAEAWGEGTYQPVARTLLWAAFSGEPRSMATYQQGQRLPKLPMPVILALAPLVTAAERRLNRVSPDAVRADLAALPGHVEHIDALLTDGVIGADGTPNAADLQIATTSRLLMSIGDLEPIFAGHPAAEHAALFPAPGHIPAGALASWTRS